MELTGLAGRATIVTGAAQGIGAGVARALAGAGATLLLTDRNAAGLSALAEELTAQGAQVATAQAELTDAQGCALIVERCVAAFGRVDALVNVAGVFRAAPVLELAIEDYDLVQAVNTRAVFLLTQAAARHCLTP
jgi:NAD(P)-dependent dehydrogenase (short-subunit alcohol dehydrogenase family)